jgi:hypothetical protein
MTPTEIEPATCRFVVQCLNHYVTARPYSCKIYTFICAHKYSTVRAKIVETVSQYLNIEYLFTEYRVIQ